jgi:hypothetical protein
MTKRQLKIWLSTLMITSLVLGVHTQTHAADDPDTLVKAAWDANPSISALQEKIDAAKQRLPPTGVWKDPMIALEYSNAPVGSFEFAQ